MTTATVPTIEAVAPGLRSRVPTGAFATARTVSLGVGVAALLASIAAWLFGGEHVGEQFLFSYLVSWSFGLSLALGGMFFVLVQHLTRAGWSVVVRRISENLMWTLPVLVVLFLPIVIGFEHVYHHWAYVNPDEIDPVLAGKRAYLNPAAFFARAVLYFAIWLAVAWWFRRTSIRQDETGDPALTLRMARVGAPVMLLFALSITFAAIDWLMSLDPHWFSTIWGVYFFSGSFLGFMALLALAMMALQRAGWLTEAISTEHYHDVGKLLFAFVVFWTYIAFSQYMLIWYANLPEETWWYHHHLEGTWGQVGNALIIGHFAVPFVFLMSRHIKRRTSTLAIGAVFVLVMHWIDLHWVVMPTLHQDGFELHWLDATTLVGVLGVFCWMFLRNLEKAPLVPERDPRLRESLDFVNH